MESFHVVRLCAEAFNFSPQQQRKSWMTSELTETRDGPKGENFNSLFLVKVLRREFKFYFYASSVNINSLKAYRLDLGRLEIGHKLTKRNHLLAQNPNMDNNVNKLHNKSSDAIQILYRKLINALHYNNWTIFTVHKKSIANT